MNIKDFNNTDINKFVYDAKENNLDDNQQQALDELKQHYGPQIDEMIGKFQNMSEAELITEVFKIINEKKKNGTFNPNDIDNLAKMISPLLNDEQKRKMEQLIQLIK